MKFRSTLFFSLVRPVILLAFASLIWFVPPSNAQISIQIGVSESKARKVLIKQGYREIEFYKRGFTSLRARACRNGIRYKIKINNKLRAKATEELGKCRRQITLEQARASLRKNGYKRIDINQQNGLYVAVGCKGNNRIRVTMTRFGEVSQRRSIGQCRNYLEPADIAILLKKQGYNRLGFTDRQLPKYVAEACNRKNRHVELVLNRRGEVINQRRIGRCAPPINPDTIASLLREKGYDRVNVIDNELPRYAAEACRNGNKVQVNLNRFGDVKNVTNIGECAPALSVAQITGYFRDQGFGRINVRDSYDNFVVSACYEDREKLVTLSRYGDLLDETDGGACVSRSVSDIHQTLSERGMRNVKFFVEACRNRRLIRIHFDAYGERTGRERLGSC